MGGAGRRVPFVEVRVRGRCGSGYGCVRGWGAGRECVRGVSVRVSVRGSVRMVKSGRLWKRDSRHP